MDYFISDTHFNHAKILDFERTQFENIKEHNLFILTKLKDLKLSKDDTLYHLGDFGFLEDEEIDIWNSLKCKKILIRGNHDKKASYFPQFFDKVYNHPLWYNKRILLSHEPLPVTEGTLNVHGHLHGSKLYKENYFNISIDVINYKIVNADNLQAKYCNLKKDNYKFLEEWYAPYYQFTKFNSNVAYGSNGIINLNKSLKLRKEGKDK